MQLYLAFTCHGIIDGVFNLTGTGVQNGFTSSKKREKEAQQANLGPTDHF